MGRMGSSGFSLFFFIYFPSFLSVTFFFSLRCTYESNLIYLFGVGLLFVGALYS